MIKRLLKSWWYKSRLASIRRMYEVASGLDFLVMLTDYTMLPSQATAAPSFADPPGHHRIDPELA
jgi:hypothetical protein